MKDLKSIFSFGDKPEVKDDVNIKLAGDRARACLATKEFKHYRDQYASLESKVIDELITEAANFCVSNDSTEKFGAKCLVKLTRLRDLRSLVSKVEVDAKKGIEKNEPK
jgi:hypothetical protein